MSGNSLVMGKPMDETSLGKRYVCFKCGCKFYDLKKAEPICPKCGANQNEAPQGERKRKEEKSTKYLMGE
jgi:hypothetical protein